MNNVIEQLKTLGKTYRNMPMSALEEEQMTKSTARVFAMLQSLPERSATPFVLRTSRSLVALAHAPRFFVSTPLARFLRPLATVVAVFVIIFGATTVFASYGNVSPGHPFYGMKRATERAQLVFAVDQKVKAQLHFEFVDRRLDEVTKIAEGTTEDRDARLDRAVGDLREQLTDAKTQLETLQTSHDSDVLAVAKYADRKASALRRALKNTASDSSAPAVAEKVNAAADEAQEISIAAVDVLLKDGNTSSQNDGGRRVREKFRELEDQIQLIAVRLSKLPSTSYAEVEAIGGPTYGALLVDLSRAREVLEQGKNMITRGGFEEALKAYRAGVGIMNHLEWAVGLYEKAGSR